MSTASAPMAVNRINGPDITAISATSNTFVFPYAWDDLSSDVLAFPIAPGTLVTNVIHIVDTPFDGGTEALSIGVTGDADAYLTGTSGNLAAQYNVLASSAVATDNASGRYYATAGDILITHAAGLTVGAGRVIVEYLQLGEVENFWRASYGPPATTP